MPAGENSKSGLIFLLSDVLDKGVDSLLNFVDIYLSTPKDLRGVLG